MRYILLVMLLGISIVTNAQMGYWCDSTWIELTPIGEKCYVEKNGADSSRVKEYVSRKDVVHQENHAWVVDGAMKVMHHEGYYYPGTNILYENTIAEQYNYTDYYTYIWINWGWGRYPEKSQYSFEQVAYLWDIPLQVSTSIFATYANETTYNFTGGLKMWTNVKPN